MALAYMAEPFTLLHRRNGRCPGAAGDAEAGETRPGHPAAQSLARGNAFSALGQLEDAEAAYREAIRLGDDAAPAAWSNLGNLLKQQGRLEAAEAAYRAALGLRPRFAEALTNLGNLLAERGRGEEAEACCREAIRLRPDLPEPYNNLANLLRPLGQLEEAEAACREALRLRPRYVSALNNLGNALRDQSRFEEAERCYRDVIASQPDHVESLNNLGTLLYDQGQPAAAEAQFRAALALRPDYVDGQVNLALNLLLMGRFEEGWERYEWRWQRRKPEQHRGFDQPLWDGGPTGDRVLLIHAEQGFGDTLQFCRFAAAAAIGRRVVLEVQPALVELLRCLPGIEQVVARGARLPPFDCHCPLLSVPHKLGSSLSTLPTAPYLRAEPSLVDAWRHRLAPLDGLKIGLVWAGNPTMAADRRRSIRLAQLGPLGRLPGLHFISLQKGPEAAQAAEPPPGMALHDWTGELKNFADTAALIEALDLVIGVDTGVVHLAGALGKPTWLLNRYDRCWRWMIDRDDSPWYPSLRQFRQDRPGDWAGVIERVAGALAARRAAATSAENAQSVERHYTAALDHH
jgi:Flp pilus assembly protein TadD